MAKLRFLEISASETYMKELLNEEAKMAPIIRLNMFETFTHNLVIKRSVVYAKKTRIPENMLSSGRPEIIRLL